MNHDSTEEFDWRKKGRPRRAFLHGSQSVHRFCNVTLRKRRESILAFLPTAFLLKLCDAEELLFRLVKDFISHSAIHFDETVSSLSTSYLQSKKDG